MPVRPEDYNDEVIEDAIGRALKKALAARSASPSPSRPPADSGGSTPPPKREEPKTGRAAKPKTRRKPKP
jgi:hypothetical protein